MIVIMAGLPGTGKTTLANALAAELHGVVINKDAIRAALFPPELIEYSDRQDDFIMGVMLDTAAYVLAADPGRIVFLDGRTFSRSYQRQLVADAAQRLKQPLKVIETITSPEIARQRLEADAATGVHPAANRDWALYEHVRSYFEPLPAPKLAIDTTAPVAECVAKSLWWLR